jgi:hypothetical protein
MTLSREPMAFVAFRAQQLAIVLGLALPVFLSLNFVARFAVDVPYMDQWDLVSDLEKWQTGTFGWTELVAPHNEHRIVFPKLAMLMLSAASGWDTRWEMWLNWLLLLGLSVVLLQEHRRAFGRDLSALALFVPVAWQVLTLRQEENLLWGFQLQITMAAFAAVASLISLAAGRLLPAILFAVVSSFSFSAGLAVWMGGVALCVWQRQWRRLLTWLLGAACAAAVYFWKLEVPYRVSPLTLPFEHPIEALRFLFALLGAPIAPDTDPVICAAAGAVLCALWLFIAVSAWQKTIEPDRAALGVGLIAFASVAATLITVGRLAVAAPLPGRYTTLTLLGIVGSWRCALALRAEASRSKAAAVVATLIVIGAYSALETEFTIGTAVRSARMGARDALLDWRNRSDEELNQLFPRADQVRSSAPTLERLGLSVFRK